MIFRHILLLVLGGLFSLRVSAQSEVCNALLSDGVFNKSTSIGAWNNYQHVSSLYCSDEASTYEKAKNLSINGTVPIEGVLVSLGFTANESGYSDMRHKMCFSKNEIYSLEGWLDQRISSASQLIVDGYVKCATSLTDGVFQRIEGEDRESSKFVWRLDNKVPSDQKITFKPIIPSNILCKSEDGNVVKSGTPFVLGHNGRVFSCERQNCESSVLVASSTFAVRPSYVRISGFYDPPPPPPPKKHIVYSAESMNQMWSRSIPGTTTGEVCRLINTTEQWNCHYDSNDCQRLCDHNLQPLSPIITIVGNVASSNDFDSGAYGDNAGVCKYTFECEYPNPIENFPAKPAYCSK